MTRAAWALFVCVQAAPSGRAEIGSPVRPPPQPVPLTVKVERGGSIHIPLRIFGLTGEQINFRIRANPKFGALSNPRVISKELSAITYTHSGEAGHTSDSFSYAAQSSVGVSASVPVTVQIVDVPSILVVPSQIDFATLFVGRSDSREITLANRGGGIASGIVTADAPWQIEGNRDYRLAPGATATFTLTFGPPQPRGHRGVVRYSSDPTRLTNLRGAARAPFTVEPVPLRFETRRETAGRTAQLTLINQLDTNQTIALDTGEIIQGPGHVTLAPEARQSVTLTIPPSLVRPVSKELMLRGDGYAMALPVEAPAPGALLQVEPTAIDLGERRIGEAAAAQLTVSNTGGERTFVRATIQAPFSVRQDDSGFTLEPGQTHEVEIQLDPTQPGRFRTLLRLETYDALIETIVSASVTGTEPAPAPGASPTPIPRERVAQPSPKESPGTLPPVREVTFTDVTRSRCTMAWDPPAPEARGYKLEERILSINSDAKLQIDWIPVTDAEVTEAGGRPRVTFEDLRPGYPYTVRIIAIDSEGGTSRPSPGFRFITQPSRQFAIRPLHILLAILAVLAILIARQRFFTRPGEDQPTS